MRRRILTFAVLLTVLGFGLSAAAQQEVRRYDLFGGYSHLSSPSVSLEQNGFDVTFGVNVKRWLALGSDFSWFDGNGTIAFADTKVAPQLAPYLPAGANPKVPFSAKTYTWAAGPQVNIRHFNRVMFFVRPGLGLLHERAEPTISPDLGALLQLLASQGVTIPGLKPKMNDTVPFYGFGGGFEINVNSHMGIRFSTDFVHTTLFSDLLEGRNAVRFSIAPNWKWGKDISK